MTGEKEKTDEGLQIRGPGRCPFCRDQIHDLKHVVACAQCGARHHEACHTEHGACASCGSTQVLVTRSKARERREQPPRGSTIEVERLPGGGVCYSWPGFGGQALALWLVIFLGIIVTAPLAIWPIIRYLQGKRSRLILHPDRLEIERVGILGTKRYEASRDEVGAVRLGRANQGTLQATFDIGVDRIPLGASTGGMPVLKEPEIEWLHEALVAWQEER